MSEFLQVSNAPTDAPRPMLRQQISNSWDKIMNSGAQGAAQSQDPLQQLPIPDAAIPAPTNWMSSVSFHPHGSGAYGAGMYGQQQGQQNSFPSDTGLADGASAMSDALNKAMFYKLQQRQNIPTVPEAVPGQFSLGNPAYG